MDHAGDDPPADGPHSIDDYRTDPVVTSLVDTTELWFLPAADPDGYDFTFSGVPQRGCGARICATTMVTAKSRSTGST
jgi:hypothetical protein